MKKIVLTLIVLNFLFFGNKTLFADQVEEGLKKMAQELESKYPGRVKAKVAVLQFRTSDNRLTKFSQYIQGELVKAYSNSLRYDVIDPNAINKILETSGWNLDNALSYKSYSDLGELIFQNLGIAPDVFMYGQINDNDETITITGYLVPGGVKSTNIQSIITFNSSELTDKLLGKPVKVRPTVIEKKDTVIVYKEKIIEKPIYVEKEVIKETPVYIEKEQNKENTQQSNQQQSTYKAKLENLEIEIVKAENVGGKLVITVNLLNNSEDQKLPTVSARFFDTSGNEFENQSNTLTWVGLIAGVPAKKTITFTENVGSVDLIRVIEIEFNQLGKVQIKNIPVTK